MASPGTRARMRVDDAAQERGAVLERPAVGAGPVDRAEQLVEEVAVAVLDVDEVEPGVGGEHGGVDVGRDERVEVVVGEERCVVRADTRVSRTGWW